MKATLYFTLTLLTFVTLVFVPNSFAQEYVVRVIYFYPNDIEPQEDSVNTLKAMIKDIQKFYADEMERHGYGRKTFRLETDENENVMLHYMKGNFDHTRYNEKSRSRNEIRDRLDSSKEIIYLIWVDRYAPGGRVGDVGGSGSGTSARGSAWIFPSNFDSGVRYRDAWETMAHEIGHAFGLGHDYRKNAYIMSYGPGKRNELSPCTAKWLDAHKYFNDTVTSINDNTSIQMLPPNPAESLAIRFRFNISDTDGLHQVIFDARGDYGLVECKELSGHSSTVEFITNMFDSGDTSKYGLLIMDRYGNFRYHGFQVRPIDVLPPSEVVPIPDANLAAAIREALKLAPDSNITQLDMLGLQRIYWKNPGRQITDLTGLEHAINLRSLGLHGNQIEDITPLAKLTKLSDLRLTDNQIEDITPLAKLTKLNHLRLDGNQIEDITPLSKLANSNLRELRLSDNQIEDITPLSKLTKLIALELSGNQQIRDLTPLKTLTNLISLEVRNSPISDITPLAGLTNLVGLYLPGNQISDITPLAGLTNLQWLWLYSNQINDVTPLAGLTNLRQLYLMSNQISDVSLLAGLINIETLRLEGNPIKNRKPLLELLKKNPDVKIFLKNSREPLPVNLSHFRAEHTNAGVILKWTTESELDNAGFYIYRSPTKDGEFKVVNPTMIQGAGTTGERNEYIWTDTTAKPNTVYYYRIEDVSHAGEREQLAAVRLRGLISARGKLTTIWADLKAGH
ncbi:MAG: leucine-rich repeat domain-containing protein [Candidatus Poribacteria bacterium]|nr:leucine-rich repeat domain-containing protein [Candidatus Poribacteria bacterium]